MSPELFKLFGIDPNADNAEELLTTAVTTMHSEASALRKAVDVSSQEAKMQAEFPDVWEKHQELMKRDRETSAKSFVDSVSTVTRAEGTAMKPTTQGMSAFAMETVTQTHMKFADGTASVDDFETCIKAVTQGGIVDYAEKGSAKTKEIDPNVIDTSTAAGLQNARMQFGALVNEIQREDELSYEAAIAEAARRNPKLAAAYHQTISA